MNGLKTWITAALLPLLLHPAGAQGQADTTWTFRFVPEDDMFYVPWNGNGLELARLQDCVESNMQDILGGSLPLYVDGWCSSLDSEKENLRMAAIRSNRVKSELIVRCGIKEECFITRNHTSDGDFVIVRLTVPAPEASAVEPEGPGNAEEERLSAGRAEQERKAAEEAGRQRQEQERAARAHAERERTEAARPAGGQSCADSLARERAASGSGTDTVGPPGDEAEAAASYTLSLRANLLRWATLTPDVGIEWRITPSVGIAVNGSWTSWTWQDNNRRYALWEVAPEVRYYMGREKRGYLGAMFKAGQFNYKLSGTGRQGDLTGGGITGGYQLRLSDALSLDFNVAVGCLHADYEKYEVIDGVRVRAGKETKNWWGPINAGVTLVWKLF